MRHLQVLYSVLHLQDKYRVRLNNTVRHKNMDYLLIVALTAIPASIAAMLMTPNPIRYFNLAVITGFIFALVAIDIPNFISQFDDIMASPQSIWSWVIWFIAFMIPPVVITFLAELSIGGCKIMRKKMCSRIESRLQN